MPDMVRGKKVFLSGPMRGHEDDNRDSFDRAERLLHEMGALFVYNPARRLRDYGGQRMDWSDEQVMAVALRQLLMYDVRNGDEGPRMRYDLMVQIHGWQDSEGCRVEAMAADACGIERVQISELAE